MIDFDVYFELLPLMEFHRVIPMREFMQEIADKVWPKEKRQGSGTLRCAYSLKIFSPVLVTQIIHPQQ